MTDMRIIAPISPAGNFPVTETQYISDENGVRLNRIIEEQGAKIASYTTDINNLKTLLTTVQSDIVNKEEKILHFKTWADYEKVKNTIPVDTYFVIEEDAGEDVYKKIEQIESEIAVQTARMDQLVGTVPAGSADEIADARVMTDGKTANNLGTAIRSQVSRLKEQIQTQKDKGYAFNNVIEYPFYNTTKTASGITFTDNGDGTVTANGTATANVTFFLVHYSTPINLVGKYKMTGCPAGGSHSKYHQVIATPSGSSYSVLAEETGNGMEYDFESNVNYCFGIRIYNGCTVDNIVFKPELVSCELMSNLELREYIENESKTLTEDIDSIKDYIQSISGEIADYRNATVAVESGLWDNGETKVSNNKRIRNINPIRMSADVQKITYSKDFEVYVYYMNENGELISSVAWKNNGAIYNEDTPEGTSYINVTFRSHAEPTADITVRIDELSESISTVYYRDKEISQKFGCLDGQLTIAEFVDKYSSANYAPDMSSIVITGYEGYDMKDYGFPENSAGMLLTFNKTINDDPEYTNGTFQIYATRYNDLYFRIAYTATFSAWRKVEEGGGSQPTETTVIDLGMFQKVGIIGDSFASGSTSFNDGVTNYSLSWLQNLARKYGWEEASNYSKGGLTSRTWLTDAKGLSYLQSDTWKQLYFIALGINDSNPKEGTYVPLGTIDDFRNANNPPDTFYGNIGRAYRAVKAKNTAAVVCFITIPRFGDRYTPYSTAIKEMASETNSMLIDSDAINLFKTSWWAANLVDAHPTAMMYNAMANAYATAFNDAALANIEYLKTYNGYLNGSSSSGDSDTIVE